MTFYAKKRHVISLLSNKFSNDSLLHAEEPYGETRWQKVYTSYMYILSVATIYALVEKLDPPPPPPPHPHPQPPPPHTHTHTNNIFLGSSVVSALASGAKSTRIDLWLRQGNFRCPNTLSFVSFADMAWIQCAIPRIETLTGGPPVQGKSIRTLWLFEMVTCRPSLYNPKCLMYTCLECPRVRKAV